MDRAGSQADRESFVRVDSGLRLHVCEWGDASGPPLLILHGGAHHAGLWAPVCERMPRQIRCIVPDARGHGQSEWSESGDYSCQSQVEDLRGLLGRLGIARFVVAGHSMGGLSALLLAGGEPARAQGLVLIDVGTETRESGLEHVSKRSREPRARTPSAAGFDPRLLEHVPTFLGDGEERRRLLCAARAPLLVMRGERSRIMSREAALRTAALVAGEMVEIAGAGHNVAQRNPGAVARALADFVLAVAEG